MDSWIVDAKDLDISAVEEFHENLFHKTGLIDEFFFLSKHATLVIAPKGYGKTLVLKEKKRRLTSDFDIHPKNAMLDRPSGVPNFKTKEYADILLTDSYWKMLWLLSIGFIIVRGKTLHGTTTEALPKKIASIMYDTNKKTPCEVLTNLLLLSRSDYHVFENFYHSDLASRIRDIRNQTAFFIDNIDEFFEQRLYDSRNQSERVVHRELWGASQVGLALAARDLSSINPHIKVFASIRKEVVPRLVASHGVGLQVKGASIEINYQYEDLFDILLKNIKNDNPLKKPNPSDDDYCEAFFGQDFKSLFHPKTGDEESAANFLLRHTLRRPRDISHIGRAIKALEPKLRQTKRLREVIATASTEISEAYFAEMQPHLDSFFPEILFPLIPTNALSKKQIKNISAKYDALAEPSTEADKHVFCNLYKLGLLGWVATDVLDGTERQYFLDIGEVALKAKNCLPDSKVYLIHPILDETIIRHNRKYIKELNSLNVIGYKRIWRTNRPFHFAAKGDLKGFSGIMADSDKYSAFAANFVSDVKDLCGGVDARFEGGDSMLLLSNNPRYLLDTVLRIDNYTKKEYNLPMRFGCDVGYVEFVGLNGQIKGAVLRRSARLENAVKTAGIFLTEEYIKEADNLNMRIGNVEQCQQADLPHLNFDGGKFNIAKSRNDEDTYVAIYRSLNL